MGTIWTNMRTQEPQVEIETVIGTDENEETITDESEHEDGDDESESECDEDERIYDEDDDEDDDDAATEEAPGKVTTLYGTTISEEEADKQPTDFAAAKKIPSRNRRIRYPHKRGTTEETD